MLSSLLFFNTFSLCLLNSGLFALDHRRYDGHQVEDHLKMEILEELEQSGGAGFEPLFVMTERHVKAPSGGSAYLRCRILQLGDRTVSWVRQSDLQILTAGNYTYTSDKRFRALHSPMSNDLWTLELRESTVKDSGVYECQIPSSNDNKLSLSVSLQVVEMVTEILEGPVVLIRRGYDVKLRCLINFVPDDMSSSYVFWFRDKKMLNYDTTSRSSVTTTKTMNGSSEMLLSELQLRDTDQSDSGNYSCQLHAQNIDPVLSPPAHVQVLVLDKSEYSSAIQGLSSRDGSRVHPAKGWSAATPLSSPPHATLLLSLLGSHMILIRLGLR